MVHVWIQRDSEKCSFAACQTDHQSDYCAQIVKPPRDPSNTCTCSYNSQRRRVFSLSCILSHRRLRCLALTLSNAFGLHLHVHTVKLVLSPTPTDAFGLKKMTQKSRDHLPAITQAEKNRKDGNQDPVSPPGLRNILHVNPEYRYSDGWPATLELFVVLLVYLYCPFNC